MTSTCNRVFLMSLSLGISLVAASVGAGCGGGNGDGDDVVTPDARGELFQPKPECDGDPVVALAGSPRVVISHLEIGDLTDGFDLDGDGAPDNKLFAVRSLAGGAIEDAFTDYSLMIPFEFFDMPAAAVDDCVKFAIYLGNYAKDGDDDGQKVAKENGDCNDLDGNIFRGAAEIAGNGIDDNCDGRADEDESGNASTSTADADGDGRTIADGDCDDTRATVGGLVEICGDGLDNNCDGVADRAVLGDGSIACNPYDTVDPEPLPLDPLSFDAQGKPVIQFTSGTIENIGGVLKLTAGPSVFAVTLPISDDINLELKLTGTSIEADVLEDAAGIHLVNGRIGGIIDVQTADSIRGLDVEQIGLLPENSLLDAIFANLLGPLLALPAVPPGTVEYSGCRMPDIDVDGDGREAFCDLNVDDADKVVGVCIDGDGTIVLDTPEAQCTEAIGPDGKKRFVDGISVELNFDAAAAGDFVVEN